MTKLKIKKGDQVIVLSGNHKGKTGIIKKISPKTNKVIITGINIITTRLKSGSGDQAKKMLKKESPLHISKVAMLDIKSGKPTKIGLCMKNGTKIRFLKRSGEYLNNVINHKTISQ